MLSHKLKPIKQQLKQYLDEIQNFEFSGFIPGRTIYSPEESKEFLTTICDFIHYATGIQEIADILQNLLSFHHNTPTSYEVKKINNKLSSEFIKIANVVKKLPNWQKFCNTEKGKYSHINPFNKKGEINKHKTLTPKNFIETLSKFKKYNGNTIDQVETIRDLLVDTQEDLNGILDKYLKFNKKSFPIINDIVEKSFRKINTSIRELKELFEYNPHFAGVFAIDELLSIYQSIHPNPHQKPNTKKLFINYIFIGKGLFQKDVEKLKKATSKIVRIINNSLDTKVIKRTIVRRFKALCELYELDTILDDIKKTKNPEKVVQKQWERFAFLHGYYPITEAQLKTGRFDTLIASSSESALLTELKQVGLSSSKASIKKQLKKAGIQIESYKRKLEGFPNLDNHVYILLFSKTPLFVTNNHIEVAGISFHLEVIQLTKKSESKRKSTKIDIKDILN